MFTKKRRERLGEVRERVSSFLEEHTRQAYTHQVLPGVPYLVRLRCDDRFGLVSPTRPLIFDANSCFGSAPPLPRVPPRDVLVDFLRVVSRRVSGFVDDFKCFL